MMKEYTIPSKPIRHNRRLSGRAARAVVFLLLPMVFLSACGAGRDLSVIVAGSTSVQPYVEMLAEAYCHIYPDRQVDVQGGGSSAGITAVESKAADIGMSSRHLKPGEAHLWSVEIAKDGLAVIVNPKNPIDDLSLDQIRRIYTGDVSGWNELGGLTAKIHVITREEGSGSRGAFEELVMGSSFITPKAIVQDSNGAVKQLVADDPNAIGFISLGLVDHTVKALRTEGVRASVENVMNGSYHLHRPFLFVMLNPPEGLVRQFTDYILSDAGREALIKEGLIPAGGGAP